MKHLEEAFPGVWHMHVRAGEEGAGAEDTRQQGLELNLRVPGLVAERQRW